MPPRPGRFAGAVKADLPGDMAGTSQVLALQDQAGEPAALQYGPAGEPPRCNTAPSVNW
ncbi:hypothetical protein ACFV0T_37380 [Streptomyces sp. NPDC059582]|uniref:hypothetical protein n=1 Tax=Streptomyces sp. NPDC059582 TaxID=3346875 RepID=UPI0036987B56